jgi:hypothetical protein
MVFLFKETELFIPPGVKPRWVVHQKFASKLTNTHHVKRENFICCLSGAPP